jgi:peptidoglycan hydrolase CwlO-like protein
VRHDEPVAKKKQQAKKAPPTADKGLKAAVDKLQARLGAAEKSVEKWKARAKEHKSLAAGAQAELGVVRRRLAKAEASATKWKERAEKRTTAAPVAAAAPAASAAGAPPVETWTVTRLRAEARSRGVTGYSRMTKDQLLAAVRR